MLLCTPEAVVRNFNLAGKTFSETVIFPNKGENYLILVAENQAVGANTVSIKINDRLSKFLLTQREAEAFTITVQ